jgi:CRP/FNR family transcriptional regulator, anaerobic regulatory protein
MTEPHDLALRLSRGLAARPELRGAGIPRVVPKGGHVFRADDDDNIFILEHGLVKLCFLPRDGKEWIRSFVAAPGAFGLPFLQSPEEGGSFTAVSLEPCTFVVYSYDLLLRLGALYPDLARVSHDLIRVYALQRERRWRNMLSLPAEDAYREFLNDHPGLSDRITQADIARYLGITAVALSRIRGRMGHMGNTGNTGNSNHES